MRAIENAVRRIEENERRLLDIARLIDQEMPEEDFQRLFPVPYGMQISAGSNGLALTAPLPLPREWNNCWGIIRQMKLWKKWLSGKVRHAGPGERYLAEVRYYSVSELPFIPNPIEIHPMIDGLTSILGMDDNLSRLDHFIRVLPLEKRPEYCEIRLNPLSGQQDLSVIESPPLALVFPDSCEEIQRKIQELMGDEKGWDSLCEEEKKERFQRLGSEKAMDLYSLILAMDQALRSEVSYSDFESYYPLRKRSGFFRKQYAELFSIHPFCLVSAPDNNNSFFVISNVPFLSRERESSNLYAKELSGFLLENADQLPYYKEVSYRLEIRQKGKKPDGDNLPFDSISKAIQKRNSIHIIPELRITYSPDSPFQTMIFFKAESDQGTRF